MIFFGNPSSPERSRRTRTFPREPVPPVTRIRLFLKLFVTAFSISSPSFIRCWIPAQLHDELLPRRSPIACCVHKLFPPHAPVAKELIVSHDLNIEFKRTTYQIEEIVFRNCGAG